MSQRKRLTVACVQEQRQRKLHTQRRPHPRIHHTAVISHQHTHYDKRSENRGTTRNPNDIQPFCTEPFEYPCEEEYLEDTIGETEDGEAGADGVWWEAESTKAGGSGEEDGLYSAVHDVYKRK